MGPYQEVNKTYTAQESKQQSKPQEVPKIYKIHTALPSAMKAVTGLKRRDSLGR